MKPIAITLVALACFAFVVLAAVGSLVALPFVAAWHVWRAMHGCERVRALELRIAELEGERDALATVPAGNRWQYEWNVN